MITKARLRVRFFSIRWKMKKILIDAHEDIAYAAISFNRDYSKSAADIRQIEQFTDIPQWNGHAMLGHADWKKANVGIIFATLFVMPKQYQTGDWEKVVYRNFQEAESLLQKQVDYYSRLEGNYPEKFLVLRNNYQYQNHWEKLLCTSEIFPPIGLVMLMEGAEALKHPEEIEDWYQKGVRIVGPAWAGGKYSGGMYEPGGLTNQGRLLLEIMSDLGIGLDIAHMSEQAVYQALDIYGGAILSSHANVKSFLQGKGEERHLSDPIIRRIAERDGVMGLMPYNRFLVANWTKSIAHDKVTLEHYVNHIDHICQITGSVNHVAIGTDFDGGYGYPDVPVELISIGDLPQVDAILATRGYNQDEINAIFSMNWKRILDRIFSK
jgi:membrane dipeptidase